MRKFKKISFGHSNNTNMILKAILVCSILVSQLKSAFGQNETDLVDCPFCTDPTYEPQSYGTFYANGVNGNVISCNDAFELSLKLPVDQCDSWQNYGTNFCKCAAEPPEKNECTLCTGGTLPEPLKAAPSSPVTTCASVQIQAKRDFADRCTIYQQTMGIYCGCENFVSEDTCHLCGENMIFDPLKKIPALEENTTITCGEVEFQANFPDSGLDCEGYQVSTSLASFLTFRRQKTK